MIIILIRHGESADDTMNRYGGAADFPLSDLGRQATKEITRTLQDAVMDRIYSSPLKRAIQTAEIIDATKQCGITTIANLRERNSYGVLSGCSKEESKEVYGYLLSDLKEKPGDYYSKERILGAEPSLEFDHRVKNALNSVVSDAIQNGYKAVAVVTHGNVTRSIYQNILNFAKKIDIDHLAKTVIGYHNDTFILISKEGIYEKN